MCFYYCCIFYTTTINNYIVVLGFMQFVQSVPVAEVLATEGNIQVSIEDKQSGHRLHIVLADNNHTVCFNRASSESMHQVKKDPTASAQR